jgi:hypothetical protein
LREGVGQVEGSTADLTDDNRDHRHQEPVPDREQRSDPGPMAAPAPHRAPGQPIYAGDVIRVEPVPQAQHQHQQQA